MIRDVWQGETVEPPVVRTRGDEDISYAPGTAGTMGGVAGEGPPVPTGTPAEFPLFVLTP